MLRLVRASLISPALLSSAPKIFSNWNSKVIVGGQTRKSMAKSSGMQGKSKIPEKLEREVKVDRGSNSLTKI
jgi:hypothetical protein